jgi:hypothetical protein
MSLYTSGETINLCATSIILPRKKLPDKLAICNLAGDGRIIACSLVVVLDNDFLDGFLIAVEVCGAVAVKQKEEDVGSSNSVQAAKNSASLILLAADLDTSVSLFKMAHVTKVKSVMHVKYPTRS